MQVTPFFARFVYYGLLKLTRFPMKISFCEILKKQIAPCVCPQTQSFYLNGHIIGFRPQTLKLECLYKTPSNTLAANTISKHSTEVNYIVERDKEKNVPPQPPVTKSPLNICVKHPTKLKPMHYLLIIISFYFRH